MSKRRRDIDGLRAVAVLAVIVEHLNRRWLPGGFTGVDVFFVISGFVITTSLLTHQANSVVDYVRGFYARRIRRILPALFACIAITTVLTALFIPPINIEYRKAVASFVGMNNLFSILQKTNYFALDQTLDPYMHTWSLGVEEQFYLIYPFLLLLSGMQVSYSKVRSKKDIGLILLIASTLSLIPLILPGPSVGHVIFHQIWSLLPLIPLLPAMIMIFRIINPGNQNLRQALVMLSITLFLSFAYSAMYTTLNSPIAGYSMQSRFWELAAGAILSLITHAGFGKLTFRTGKYFQFLAVILLGMGFAFISGGHDFPIPLALIPVVATVLLIMLGTSSETQLITKMLSMKIMVGIGRISYSLYLWHWPIMVIMRWTVGLNSVGKILIYAILTTLFSLLSYWFIEQPFQRSRSLGTVLAPALATVCCALLLYANIDNPIFQKVYAFQDVADRMESHFYKNQVAGVPTPDIGVSFTPIRSVAKPYAIFVIGDSHAGHFEPMLKEIEKNSNFKILIWEDGRRVYQLADETDSTKNETNKNLLQILHLFGRNLKANDIVFTSLRYSRIYDKDFSEDLILERNGGDVHAKSAKNIALIEQNLLKIIEIVESKKATLILAGDVPMLATPALVSCLVQSKIHLKNACDVPRSTSVQLIEPLTQLYAKLAKHPHVYFWNPHDLLCEGEVCTYEKNSQINYFDSNHLTEHGARNLYSNFLNFLKLNHLMRANKNKISFNP